MAINFPDSPTNGQTWPDPNPTHQYDSTVGAWLLIPVESGGDVAWDDVTSKPSTFPPDSHNHAASDITSGTIATARLGSGTADNTTFLRGDNTWATPAGGGDGYLVNVVLPFGGGITLSPGQTHYLTPLFGPLDNNGIYEFEAFFHINGVTDGSFSAFVGFTGFQPVNGIYMRTEVNGGPIVVRSGIYLDQSYPGTVYMKYTGRGFGTDARIYLEESNGGSNGFSVQYGAYFRMTNRIDV